MNFLLLEFFSFFFRKYDTALFFCCYSCVKHSGPFLFQLILQIVRFLLFRQLEMNGYNSAGWTKDKSREAKYEDAPGKNPNSSGSSSFFGFLFRTAIVVAIFAYLIRLVMQRYNMNVTVDGTPITAEDAASAVVNATLSLVEETVSKAASAASAVASSATAAATGGGAGGGGATAATTEAVTAAAAGEN